MEKLVSVIILNYNNYHFTLECLKSLTQQTYKKFEVILIDNGSKHNLFLELKKKLTQFNNKLEINLVRSENNLYFVAGNNKAIKMAKGDYICLINYDVILNSEYLEAMVNFIETHPNAGMVTPKIKVYKDKTLLWNTGAYLNFRSAIVIGNRGHLEYDPLDKKYNEIETIGFAPGTAVFINKKVINEIGLMDEIFIMYHEDPDWNLRAQKVGYKSYYVPTVIIYHNVPRFINEKRMIFNHFFFTRNSQILVWKHAKFIDLLIYYYIFCVMHFGAFIFSVITGKFESIVIRFKSIWQGFRIGLRRRSNRTCRKYLISDYNYIKKIQKF